MNIKNVKIKNPPAKSKNLKRTLPIILKWKSGKENGPIVLFIGETNGIMIYGYENFGNEIGRLDNSWVDFKSPEWEKLPEGTEVNLTIKI